MQANRSEELLHSLFLMSFAKGFFNRLHHLKDSQNGQVVVYLDSLSSYFMLSFPVAEERNQLTYSQVYLL